MITNLEMNFIITLSFLEVPLFMLVSQIDLERKLKRFAHQIYISTTSLPLRIDTTLSGKVDKALHHYQHSRINGFQGNCTRRMVKILSMLSAQINDDLVDTQGFQIGLFIKISFAS